jgi:proteic killer suppression protein
VGLVIVSFRCAETEKIFHEQRSRKFDSIHRAAFRRLHSLDAATALGDLAGGGMAVEALKRDRIGQHSIRVNDQYRICFVWQNGNAAEVEIVDYH